MHTRKTPQESTRLRAGHPSHCLGFTLIEVIVVMTVIGIMATIAIPTFMKWMPNINLKIAARELYTNMQMAKIQSIKENREWALVFDTANDSYDLCDDPGADNQWNTAADNHVVKTVLLSSYKYQIQFGNGGATPNTTVTYAATTDPDKFFVRFDPRGFGTAGYAYLQNENQTDSFAVGTPLTGTVRLVRWKGGSTWQ